MRSKLNTSPRLILVLVVVFVLGIVSAAGAASVINGKNIKKGSIPLKAISSDAQKKLKGKTGSAGPQGPQGPAGANAPTYWAQINQGGDVAKSSPGVSSTHSQNSGFWQYRVTFPRDVSACGFGGNTTDSGVIGTNEYVIPTFVTASRSNQGANIVAVNVWTAGATQTSIEDSFFLGVYC